MKQIQILIFLFFASSIFAQKTENGSNYFIESSIARYAEVPGLLKGVNYENKIDFLNGFKIGMRKNERTEMYVSLMKYNSTLNNYYLFTAELYTINGYQIGLGLKKRLFNKNRFSSHIGSEILFQLINYEGDYWTDEGTSSVSNSKTFEPGIASVLDINYKISDKLSITANTRIGIYYRISNSDFISSNHVNILFEPVNSIGIRFSL